MSVRPVNMYFPIIIIPLECTVLPLPEFSMEISHRILKMRKPTENIEVLVSSLLMNAESFHFKHFYMFPTPNPTHSGPPLLLFVWKQTR